MRLIINNYRQFFFLILCSTVFLTSCKKDVDVKVITPADEVAGLQKLQEFTQGDYTFYIYKKDTGNLVVVYNEV